MNNDSGLTNPLFDDLLSPPPSTSISPETSLSRLSRLSPPFFSYRSSTPPLSPTFRFPSTILEEDELAFFFDPYTTNTTSNNNTPSLSPPPPTLPATTIPEEDELDLYFNLNRKFMK